MTEDTHQFFKTYTGIGAFGMDRKTDEESVIFYLQKFSEDALIQLLVKRMTDEELEEIYSLINRKLTGHLSPGEYKRMFLKDHCGHGQAGE